MKTILRALAAAILLLIESPAHAGGGPQNVALVVNADSWASLAIANEYIHLRGIPANNVIYLNDVPNFETLDIGVFREKILIPILKAIEDRHLKPQIDYVVYSADFPYAVETTPETKDLQLGQVFTRTASLTSMTYLYERVLAKDPGYLHLDVNRYMRWTKMPERERIGQADRQRYMDAMKLSAEKKFDAALPLLDTLSKAHPKNQELQYNHACCLARLKKNDEAIATLKAAIDSGWFDVYHMRDDEDLAGLRDRADFKELLQKVATTFVEPATTLAFRASDAWTEKCELAPDGKGEHYLLSTMLAETSGRGTSVNEALAYLRAAAAADGTAPTGTIYYMINGDIRSKTRRWGFSSAIKQLTDIGVKAEVLNGNLPEKKSDVMGAMAGISDFNWAASGSKILPGAICEHLTSCGGELAQHRGQTECSAFLRAGAAGTSGAVQEPYALQQKFPSPFIHVHYARGCSLGEAYYQSVSGPYQLIIVGDPLCAPWKRAPVVTLDGIKPNDSVKGSLTLRPGSAAQPAVGSFELYVDGLRHGTVAPGGTFTLDTTTFCDGYHEISLVGIAADRIAAQGRIVCPSTFENHGHQIILSVLDEKKDQTARISVQMKGAAIIELLANGRVIERTNGESAAFQAGKCGLGPNSIQARGYLKDNQTIAAQSQSVSLTIEPDWLSAQTKDAAAIKKGLRVEFDDSTVKIVEPTRSANWLADAGLKEMKTCKIDGWFEVPADDLYQFQYKSALGLTVDIDGRPGDILPGSEKWIFLPLALKKGAHHFHANVSTGHLNRSLDLRFGASGTRSIEAGQFQCADVKK